MGKKVFLALGFSIAISAVLYLTPKQSNRDLPHLLKSSRAFLSQGAYDSAIFLAYEVLNSGKNINNKSYAEAIIGYSQYEQGLIDSAYHHYKKSCDYSSQSDSVDHLLKASSLNMLGIIFQNKELHKRAIEYYESSIDIYINHDDPSIIKVFYNLALSQRHINDIECVKSYYKALEFATEFNDTYYEVLSLNSLGNLMLETENYESALEYFNMTISSDYTTTHNDIKSFAYQGLGEAYYHSGQYGLAEKNLMEALKIKEAIEDKRYLFTSNLYLGRLYQKMGRHKTSEKAYLNALDYFHLVDLNRENIAIFKEISIVQNKMGKIIESNENKARHYAEIEKYLDERERAAELARQDEFDTIVAVSEAHYRNKSLFSLIKNEMNWNMLIKMACLLYMAFFFFTVVRNSRRIRLALS